MFHHFMVLQLDKLCFSKREMRSIIFTDLIAWVRVLRTFSYNSVRAYMYILRICQLVITSFLTRTFDSQ